MNESKEAFSLIQNRADLLCSELSKLTRNHESISNDKINELIQIGLEISIICSENLD